MKKKFDAVAWMRERRAEIDREDEGLSWDERSRKTLERLKGDPLWERLKGRRVCAASDTAHHTEAGRRHKMSNKQA